MNCLFCKIAKGDIPAALVFEDDDIIAFRDVNPQAPAHILVIPTRHIATINDTKPQDESLLGRMILTAKNLALTEGFHET
ncbi:MAG TPA: histidine triad nucleotide-binding protein, partial [Legionella sp.]|nr:histidine triad nucleotide-binding protein [Legionella sp.]